VQKLKLPAAKKDEDPKPISYTIIEENLQPMTEGFTQMTASAAPSGVDDLPPVRFITPLGFEVWRQEEMLADELVSGRFIKGAFETTLKRRLKFVYTLRNISEKAKTIALEHIVPPGWALAGDARIAGRNGLRKEYDIALPAGKIVNQEISTESLIREGQTLEDVFMHPIEQQKALVDSPKLLESTRRNLEKGLNQLTELKRNEAQLKDHLSAIKQIEEEQARIRANIEKIPTASAIHKRYLDKLDAMETDLEKSQAKVRELEAAQKKQIAEYTAFVKGLSVE
jgi:hypothetical protein